jgi:hypothetical protein
MNQVWSLLSANEWMNFICKRSIEGWCVLVKLTQLLELPKNISPVSNKMIYVKPGLTKINIQSG